MKHRPSISRTPENLLLLSLAAIGLVAIVTGLLLILQIPTYALLLIIALIVLVLRFRTGEIGIRNGLLIGATLLITVGTTYLLAFPFLRESFRAGMPFGGTLFVYVILGICYSTVPPTGVAACCDHQASASAWKRVRSLIGSSAKNA